MNKSLKVFGLVAAASVLLAACSQPAAAPTAVPAKPAEPTKAVAPAPAPKTIRWRTRPGDAAEQKVYEELNKLANDKLKDKGITVVYDPGVNQDYFVKVKTELAAGTAPDIFWVGGVEVADFVATGKIADIKPLIDSDKSFNLGDFYKGPVGELTRDGKIYGLPRDISTMVTYYNADLFKAAGLTSPKDLAAQGKWDMAAMMDAAKKLTDSSKQQYGVGFGNWWGPAWGWFVQQAGGNIFNKERTACGLDTPDTAEGAKAAKALFDSKNIPAGDADGEALFNAGKVGMYFNGRWFTPGVRANAKFQWDVVEMPKGKVNSTWLFWGPYMVSSKADQAAAWEVMKIITSAEAMGKVANMGSNIPARSDKAAVDMFLASAPPANNQAFIKGTEYAANEAPVWAGNWSDFSGKVQSAWDDMIAGKVKPEDFGKTACAAGASTFKK